MAPLSRFVALLPLRGFLPGAIHFLVRPVLSGSQAFGFVTKRKSSRYSLIFQKSMRRL